MTPDHRAHRVKGTLRDDAPPFEMRLRETAEVILRVHVHELPPHALASRAPTLWTIRDGSFRAWTHLAPGRYHARWILGPDRVVERDVEVPPDDEWVVFDLDEP